MVRVSPTVSISFLLFSLLRDVLVHVPNGCHLDSLACFLSHTLSWGSPPVLNMVVGLIRDLYCCPICFNFWTKFLDRPLDFQHPVSNPHMMVNYDVFQAVFEEMCPDCVSHYKSLVATLTEAKQTPRILLRSYSMARLKRQRGQALQILDMPGNECHRQIPCYPDPSWTLGDLLSQHPLPDLFKEYIVPCRTALQVLDSLNPQPLPEYL